jgi:hypothetical protein
MKTSYVTPPELRALDLATRGSRRPRYRIPPDAIEVSGDDIRGEYDRLLEDRRRPQSEPRNVDPAEMEASHA